MVISEVSIRRPVFAWMLMIGLIVIGAISFSRMGVSQLPDVDFPVITITATYEGAAPEVMETDVIDPIEDAMMGIGSVKTVTSTARNGNAEIVVEFDLGRDLDLAFQDVQSKVSQAQKDLPREMDPLVITKTNPDDFPILWLAVEAPHLSRQELMLFVRDRLKDQFSTIAGVGSVWLAGYLEPNLRVWIDPNALQRYRLAVNDVIDTITSEHVESPAGRVEFGRAELNIRTLGEATSPEAFGRIRINQRGGQPNYRPIRLSEIASIEEGTEDVTRFARNSGFPAVGLGVVKQRGTNAVEVAHGVKKKAAEIQKTLPEGIKLVTAFDSTRFIEESVQELTLTLVLAALFTGLVCWLFLGSWSSTLNVLMAIPTSIVGSFIVLYFMGFTLNLFTLLGLSLAIGIVVDDAIMVLENIIRHREMGKSRFDAALVGSREITFAALAATVSIVAIFLPVAFMKGIIGKFLYQFGVTLSVAVVLSLVEALTLTPMRASQFVDVKPRRTRFGRAVEAAFAALRNAYVWSLRGSLAHRWWVIAVSLAFFTMSFASVGWLNKEFVPAQDQGQIFIQLTTTPGSSVSFTDQKVRVIEEFLKGRPEVATFFTLAGGFSGAEPNSAIVFASMKPRGERKLTQQQLMAIAREKIGRMEDATVTVQDPSQGGFGNSRGFPIEFTVQGPDWDKLADHALALKEELRRTGLVTDIDSDYRARAAEIQITPDRDRASQYGVSTEIVGQTIDAMIGGALVGRYPKGGHRYDIRLKLAEDQRPPIDRIKSLFVRNNRGELVPLADTVRVAERPALPSISRRDRERAISIFANVAKGASQQAVLESVRSIAARVLPAGYRVVFSGSAETFQETFASLIFALALGLFVAYMVLASQFNSFIDPITVFMALPFSFSGAFLALLIAGQSLNLYSMIGLVLLMGIVKKNSILLVDFTNQAYDRGRLGVREALLEACPNRLRPILMTTLATIAGAVPAALALGPGAESRIPMAVAVIGGVFVSTLLTLFVVPCVYSLLKRPTRLEGPGF